MTITHATITDLTAITALEAACFPPAEAATREAFHARLLAFPEHFWLLWDAETLVSMINGMTVRCSQMKCMRSLPCMTKRERGR